jgi:hypothetical protein
MDGRMILEVRTDAGERLDDLDTVLTQMVFRADAGEHQQLWRIDGAAAQDDLAAGADRPRLAGMLHLDCHRAAAIDDDTSDGRKLEDSQIGTLQGRMQERARTTETEPAALIEIVTAKAVLPRSGKIVVRMMACLYGRLDKGECKRIDLARLLDVELATHTVEWRGAAGVILQFLESWQNFVIRPAFVAGLFPGVVIGALAADVNAAVDRTAAAEQLATRKVNLTIIHFGIAAQHVLPIVLGVGQQEHIPYGQCGFEIDRPFAI